VSIGNVHGATTTPPRLDLPRLEAISKATAVPLVLHGGSGLDDAQLAAAIALGISKVNVNTELRVAYREAITTAGAEPELVAVLRRGRLAVRAVAGEAIARLGGAGLLDGPGWSAPGPAATPSGT
jgi:fructose/tagatose bisphosphate aldolase